VLSEDEAVLLLERTTEGYRRGDKIEDLRELARLCARLPLALRIAAERASSRPLIALEELIQDLRDESALWDLLTSDDEEVGAVRSVFAWSYRALPVDGARLFRLLGLHPGPDFGSAAAAALIASPVGDARHLLDSLAGAHLLGQPARDRYQFHDLLRAFAADQVQLEESLEQQEEALFRLVSWYLHTADAAVSASMYENVGFPLASLPPGVDPGRFTGHDEAVAWYELERDNLVAVTLVANKLGSLDLAWQLPGVLRSMYNSRHPFDEWFATTRVGLDAARRTGERFGEAYLLHSLGKANTQSQRYQEGVEAHQAALRIWRAIGDRAGEIDSLAASGLAELRLRDLESAKRNIEESVVLARELQDPHRESFSLHLLGGVLLELSEPAAALTPLREAIQISRQLRNATAEIDAAVQVCQAQLDLGNADDALSTAESSLTVASAINEPVLTAQFMIEIGRIHNARKRAEDALVAFQKAGALQRKLGNRGREAQAIDGTGSAYQLIGRFSDAADFHSAASTIQRNLGDTWQLVLAINNLGDALNGLGESADAIAVWSEALDLLNRYDDQRAIRVREQIGRKLQQDAL